LKQVPNKTTWEAEMLIRAFSRRYWTVAAFIVAIAWTGASRADPVSFKAPLSGAEEVPPLQAAGSGLAEFDYDPANRMVKWVITFSGLSGPAMMAHLHGPAQRGEKAPVVMWLSQRGSPADSPITGQATLTTEQAEQFAAGRWYVNIHTQANPGGELRGQAVFPGI
jgi:CHRD domain